MRSKKFILNNNLNIDWIRNKLKNSIIAFRNYSNKFVQLWLILLYRALDEIVEPNYQDQDETASFKISSINEEFHNVSGKINFINNFT